MRTFRSRNVIILLLLSKIIVNRTNGKFFFSGNELLGQPSNRRQEIWKEVYGFCVILKLKHTGEAEELRFEKIITRNSSGSRNSWWG